MLLCLYIGACTEKLPDGEIIIRNDIEDKEYNDIVIDQVVTTAGNVGFRKKLSPRNLIPLRFKDITSLRVSRTYQNYTRRYTVSCPAKKSQTLMKLIDIHLNRLPSGCKLEDVKEER
jgi:hypothetical protein